MLRIWTWPDIALSRFIPWTKCVGESHYGHFRQLDRYGKTKSTTCSTETWRRGQRCPSAALGLWPPPLPPVLHWPPPWPACTHIDEARWWWWWPPCACPVTTTFPPPLTLTTIACTHVHQSIDIPCIYVVFNIYLPICFTLFHLRMPATKASSHIQLGRSQLFPELHWHPPYEALCLYINIYIYNAGLICS